MAGCGCGAKKGNSVRQVIKKRPSTADGNTVVRTPKKIIIRRPAR